MEFGRNCIIEFEHNMTAKVPSPDVGPRTSAGWSHQDPSFTCMTYMNSAFLAYIRDHMYI